MKSLARIRQFVSRGLALQLYHSLILPHVDYGDIVNDAMGTVDSQKLQIMQNQCLCICCNANPRTSKDDLHKECNMPKLLTCRKLHVCNFAYAGLNNKSSNKVNAMFKPVTTEHGAERRSVPATCLKICEQNVKIRGAQYFNTLPTETRTAPSISSFKSRTKKHLYDQNVWCQYVICWLHCCTQPDILNWEGEWFDYSLCTRRQIAMGGIICNDDGNESGASISCSDMVWSDWGWLSWVAVYEGGSVLVSI